MCWLSCWSNADLAAGRKVGGLQNSQDLAKSRYMLGSVNLKDIMIDSERRHALVLRAWEATNVERDLRSVMGAVAEVLSPYVPVDGMGIVVWSGTFPTGGAPRLLDIHVAGGLPDEKVDEILRESEEPVSGPPDRPIVPHDEALLRDMHEGIPSKIPTGGPPMTTRLSVTGDLLIWTGLVCDRRYFVDFRKDRRS